MESAAGRLDKAAEMIQERIASAGDSEEVVDLQLTLSQLYSEHQQYSKAEKVISDALGERPDDQRLRFQLGAMRERQGKHEGAEEAFRAVLENDPEHAGVLNYLGYMLADLGLRLEEARDYILKALEDDPYNGSYLDSLGWVYFRLNQLDLAEKNLLLAAQINSNDGTILEHLGDLYHKLGDLNKARRYYEQSVHFADDEIEKGKVEKKLSALLKELPKSN
jgi:Tfp pilus assembly protein PilF